MFCVKTQWNGKAFDSNPVPLINVATNDFFTKKTFSNLFRNCLGRKMILWLIGFFSKCQTRFRGLGLGKCSKPYMINSDLSHLMNK